MFSTRSRSTYGGLRATHRPATPQQVGNNATGAPRGRTALFPTCSRTQSSTSSASFTLGATGPLHRGLDRGRGTGSAKLSDTRPGSGPEQGLLSDTRPGSGPEQGLLSDTRPGSGPVQGLLSDTRPGVRLIRFVPPVQTIYLACSLAINQMV
ncbi:unnamed protein product [Arctogadus glacialis]